MARFDLEEAASRLVKTYSGGMRRRLDLAASLILAPPILFLDEPTTGLDPRGRLALWEVIRDLATQGTTALLTTRYLEEADQLAHQTHLFLSCRIFGQPDHQQAFCEEATDALVQTRRSSAAPSSHTGAG